MKHNIVYLFLSAFITVLGGCASLNIDTSVYKGPMPVAIEDATQLISDIEYDSSGFFRVEFSSVAAKIIGPVKNTVTEENYKTRVKHCEEVAKINVSNGISLTTQNVESICTTLRGKSTTPATMNLSPEAKKKIGMHAKEWANLKWRPFERALEKELTTQLSEQHEQVMNALNRLRGAIVKATPNSQYLPVAHSSDYQILLAAKERFDNKYQLVTQKLAKLAPSLLVNSLSPEEISSIENQWKNMSPDRTSGIASDSAATGRVVGSPIFSKVIKSLPSDAEYWQSFNKNHFYAFWGDAQFVAVRKGLVEFRQKSLDFDPTPTIGAGTALTRAGLQIAAAVATGSIPLPTGTPKEGDATGAAQTEQLVDEPAMESNQRLLARRTFAKQEYLINLADLYEQFSVGPPPSTKEIENKLKSITALFEARLEIPKGD